MGLRQPLLGLAATAITILVALAFITLFDFPLFAGWVSFALLSIIPAQIVIAVTWGAKSPAWADGQAQPFKGLLLLAVTIAVGFVAGITQFVIVGGSVGPPTPMLVHCAIVSVVVTFFLAIIWGGWPFTSIFENPVAAGLGVITASYSVNYLLFRAFFNYGFLEGTPVYVATLDPQGMFNAWNALVFYMSGLFAMFLILHFELWPMTLVPALTRQPLLGAVWTSAVLALGGAGFYVAVVWMEMDVVRYLVRGPVAFIFGTIVILNMLQGSVFRGLTQPLKGVLSTLGAAVLGTALAFIYEGLAPVLTGALLEGPPAYESEIWLASALLGVTFPFLIFFSEFFGFWPLGTSDPKD